MSKLNKQKVFRIVMGIILLFSLVNMLIKNYFSVIMALILLILNIFSLVEYKNNKRLFVFFLMLFYFNFSVIFGKYLFGGTELLNNLYNQLHSYNSTMGIGINILLIFNTLLLFVIGPSKQESEETNYKLVNKNPILTNVLLAFIMVFILFFTMYQIINNIDYNTTVFEYLNIIFIFVFFMTKGKKVWKILFEILMLILCVHSFIKGERIGGIQILLADFFINYLDKISIKKIVLFFVIGVVGFTVIGVYGDLLDANRLEKFSIKSVYNQFSERRFASDTAISAYFPNLACIEKSSDFSSKFRADNALNYFTFYTFLGQSRHKYNLPTTIVRNYYYHSGGGFITGYFYFWFGIIGVILIGLYVGFLFKITSNSNNRKNGFRVIYSVLLISTMLRWYLYYPTFLFRGTLLFLLIYLILFKVLKFELIDYLNRND